HAADGHAGRGPPISSRVMTGKHRKRVERVGGYTTVVVGTDGSETSFRAVERAAALARDADALLVIACAYVPERPDPHAQDLLGDEAYQVTGSAPADDT